MASFVDTNVWVYAFDRGAPDKRSITIEFLRDPGDQLVVSSQVLSEFYWTVTRKLRPSLSHDDALRALDWMASTHVIDVDRDLVMSAAELAETHRLALWDAMIVRAAVRAGCTSLVTEDLNHGQQFDGVTVTNPFA